MTEGRIGCQEIINGDGSLKLTAPTFTVIKGVKVSRKCAGFVANARAVSEDYIRVVG